MNKSLSFLLFLAVILGSCGGKSSETKTDKQSDQDTIKFGALKSTEEVSKTTVYKNMTDFNAVQDKSTIIRFVWEEYYKSFPAEILKANNLQVLATTYIEDASLPEDIGKLKNLTTLVIDGAKNLTKLPESIGTLKNLKAVSIRSCKKLDIKQALTVLKKCPNIQHLDLSSMDITEVPSEIGDFANLKTLRIDQNKFSKMPDSFYKLKNIENISYSSDGIYDYTDFFNKAKNFPNLKYLNVGYSKLTGLPEILKEYPVLVEVRWREEGPAWKDQQSILATTKKWDDKFPKFSVSWQTGTGMFYDIY